MSKDKHVKPELSNELENLRKRIRELENSLAVTENMTAWYRSMVETTSDWIWEIDANGVYTYSSPKIMEILGYSPEEVLGKTPFDLMPQKQRKAVEKKFTSIAKTQKPFSGLENINLHKMGHEVVLETSGVPLFDENGSFRGYRGIDRDITERKHVEIQLMEQQEKLEILVNKSTMELENVNLLLTQKISAQKQAENILKAQRDLFKTTLASIGDAVIVTGKDAEVNFINDAAAGITGWTKEEAVGKHLEEIFRIINEKSRKKVMNPVEMVIKKGKTVGLANHTILISRNGQEIPIDDSAAPILDESGEIQGVVLIFRNVKEQRELARKIQESLQFNQKIIETSSVGIFVYHNSGQCIMANEAAGRIIGATHDQVISQNFRKLESWKKLGLLEAAEKALSLNKEEHLDVHGLSTFGKEIWFYIRFIPFIFEGEQHLLALVTNLVELKKLESMFQRQNTLLNATNAVLQETITCETIEELAIKCLSIAEEITESRFGFIGEINEKGLLDTIVISDPGWEACTIPRKEALKLLKNLELRGLFGQPVLEGKSLIINDPPNHPASIGVPEGHPEITSFLGVPLKRAGKITGLIALANKKGGYDQFDLSNIESLSGAISESLKRKSVEDEIQRQKEWLEVTLSSIGDAVIATNTSAEITFINYAASQLTGWDAVAARGKKAVEVVRIISAENRAELVNPAEIVLREKKWVGLQGTTLLVTKDAREIPVADSGAPIVDKNGNLLGAVLAFRDISESYRTQRELELLSRTAMEFMELSPEEDIFCFIGEKIKEMTGDAIVAVNSYDDVHDVLSMKVITGVSEENFLKIKEVIEEKVPGFIFEKIEKEIKDLLLSGKLQKVEEGLYGVFFHRVPLQVCRSIETSIGIKDIYSIGFRRKGKLLGNVTIFLMKDAFLNKNIIETYVSQASIILEKRIAEEKLKESEEKHRSLIEAMGEGLCLHELIYDDSLKAVDYKIIDVNPAYEHIIGVKREDVVGRLASEIYGSGEPPYLEIYERVAETGKSEFFETYFPPMKKHFSISIFSPAKGKFATVFLDISEKKRMQEELARKEKLAVLGKLAGGVGHELRNPLGVIKNSVYFLNMVLKDVQPKVKEHLHILNMQVDRADEIITNLLDFSRVKPPAKGLVPVDLLIKKALEDFTIPSNISVEIDIPQKIDAPFLDSTQIHHVLLNVIINAVQAISGKGKIIINVRQKENNILISISDTGCGIPQENLNKLFEPLFTTKAKGIGLGLAVSKSLVDANNGQISFESEPGAGTTVHLTFPTREV